MRAQRSLACALVVLISACGGGGGGGGGGGVGSAGGATAITYSGSTAPAAITASNAGDLGNTVMGGTATAALGGITGVTLVGGAPQPQAREGLAMLGRRVMRAARPGQVQATAPSSALTGAAIDRTSPCDSGSLRIAGTINDATLLGTVNVTFNSCRSGSDTVSGQASMRIDAWDPGFTEVTDFTLSATRLSLSGPGLNFEMSGTIRATMNIAANTETLTENIVALDNTTRRMTKVENLVIVSVYNNIFSPQSHTQTINGRVYDSVHGYVDVTTTAPLAFATVDQSFPGSGVMVLTGASNRSIRLEAASTTLLRVRLDLDGNGAYETAATLKWADLGTAVASDLADTDGDGMHNSWETANGLNPANAADGALDRDGDGASNSVEYLAGTGPQDPGSAPPTAGLSISIVDSPDPVTAGATFTYTITVTNSSGTAATNVVVTDTLPAGVTLVSAGAVPGSCSGTTTVTCNIGTVFGFSTATVTISLSHAVPGTLSNTATVTSSTADPDLADNTVTITTVVGEPAAGIQGLIDAAAAGATITVAPGTYTGSINFNGKNVILQSRDGPSVTTLNTASLVMAGGATLRGFTLTGAMVSVGFSAGTVIEDNIFDGSSGVSGNGASPTIARNIFRNISCGLSFLQAAIVFVNNSSPRIENNLFLNNACTGIDLTLPEGNTPRVVNNTFIGNSRAIRVDRRVPQATQVFSNNLLAHNGTALFVEFGSDANNPSWTHNLLFGNTVNYAGMPSQTGMNGNVEADPLFVDLAAGNYRLQAGSPAVNAGNGAGAPSVDFDGLPRTLVDIGAFERQ